MWRGCYSGIAGLIALLFAGMAWSTSPSKTYNGRVNSAVSNVVADKLKGMGYAESDVRFQRHMNAMMKSGKGLMGGLTGRGVGRLLLRASPLSLLLLASDMTQEAIDQDQVKLDGAALQGGIANDPSDGVVAGGSYWACTGARGGDPQSVAWQCYTVSLPWETWTFEPTSTGSWTATAQFFKGTRWHPNYCAAGGCQSEIVRVDKSASGASITCGKGKYINGSNQCVPYTYNLHNAPSTYTPMPKTFEDAALDVKPETAAKPLTDQAIAELANKWWEKTSEVDPEAIPMPRQQPITPADVARTKNPNAVPSVEDWWSPSAPASEPDRVPLPAPNTQTPGDTPKLDPATPGQGTQVDLGADPNTPAPTLETTPTILQIIGPILDLMPELRNLQIVDQPGQCPQGSFFAFNRTYVLNSHCDLINSNRAVIEAAMTTVWVILAMFIVLRA